MAITSQKLLPGSTFSKGKGGGENIKDPKKTDPSLNIYKKVVKIDKLLKDSFLLKSKEENRKKRELENQKREGKEEELESPKKFKGFEILKNALPKTGFFDSIKRFILFTFAGWLFTNLFKFLPKLAEFLKIIAPVLSWFEKGIGLLLEGIVSFIDLGYKAYDTVRSIAKTIGGEGLLEKFDALSGALNTFLNLALIAGMSVAFGGGFGGKKKGGGPGIGARPKPGTGGRPKVTTSGGGGLGRPDIRNPFRQRPTVTQGGSTSGFRMPWSRPKVTTSGGGGGGFFRNLQMPKVSGAGLAKGAATFGAGLLIDLAGQWVIDKITSPIGGVADSFRQKRIDERIAAGETREELIRKIEEKLKEEQSKGIFTDNKKIEILQTDLEYLQNKKKVNTPNDDIKIKKMSSGGKVSSSSTIKVEKKNKSKLKKQAPKKIQLGKDIGGEKQIEKIYPNPDRKFFGFFEGFSWGNILFGGGKDKKFKRKERRKIPNAINALLGVGDALSKSGDWIGSLMKAGIEIALGTMPNIKFLAKIISGVIKNVADPAISGVKSLSRELFGFAGGGEIPELSDSLISSSETLKLERSIELNLRTKFDNALKVVRTEGKKTGGKFDKEAEPKPKPPIAGKDEMIEENIQRSKEGQFTVTGGNADFWTLVAIASREDGDAQGWADVAQSIYNRVASGVYGAKTIQGIVTRDGQYEPTWKYPYYGSKGKPNKEWFNIKDAQTASKATGMSVGAMNSVAAALRDAKYQKEAASFVGGRTDFMGGSNKPGPGDVRRKENAPNNFFGWFVGPGAIAYGKTNPGPAVTPQLGDITVMQTKPKPKETKEGFSLFKPSTWFSGKDKDKDEKYEGEDPRGEGKGEDGKYSPSGSNIVSIGKSLISKGFAVAEHPDFTKTIPKGSYTPGKGYVSDVHSGDGHYQGRAVDVTDWRGSLEDSKKRYRSVLDSLWANRQKNNIKMLIHDSWGYAGSWGKDPPGSHGHPTHMHIETKEGGGLISPSKPNMPIPDSFASYNDPRKSSTLAIQPVIIEKNNPIPVNSSMYFPSSGSSMVNNSVLPSLMQG